MTSLAVAMFLTATVQAQAPAYSRCDAVTISVPADTLLAEGTVVGIPGDRVRWVKAGVFVNDRPIRDLCGRRVDPPFPIPPDVGSVEVMVPLGQLFVASEASAVRPGQDIVVRHFGLVAESTVVTAPR